MKPNRHKRGKGGTRQSCATRTPTTHTHIHGTARGGAHLRAVVATAEQAPLAPPLGGLGECEPEQIRAPAGAAGARPGARASTDAAQRPGSAWAGHTLILSVAVGGWRRRARHRQAAEQHARHNASRSAVVRDRVLPNDAHPGAAHAHRRQVGVRRVRTRAREPWRRAAARVHFLAPVCVGHHSTTCATRACLSQVGHARRRWSGTTAAGRTREGRCTGCRWQARVGVSQWLCCTLCWPVGWRPWHHQMRRGVTAVTPSNASKACPKAWPVARQGTGKQRW